VRCITGLGAIAAGYEVADKRCPVPLVRLPPFIGARVDEVPIATQEGFDIGKGAIGGQFPVPAAIIDGSGMIAHPRPVLQAGEVVVL